MQAEDFREMTPDELIDQIEDLEQNLFLLRMQHGANQLDNTSKLIQARRNLARAKTVLREHELGVRLLAGHR